MRPIVHSLLFPNIDVRGSYQYGLFGATADTTSPAGQRTGLCHSTLGTYSGFPWRILVFHPDEYQGSRSISPGYHGPYIRKAVRAGQSSRSIATFDPRGTPTSSAIGSHFTDIR
jgi:hypothetical protein